MKGLKDRYHIDLKYRVLYMKVSENIPRKHKSEIMCSKYKRKKQKVHCILQACTGTRQQTAKKVTANAEQTIKKKKR